MSEIWGTLTWNIFICLPHSSRRGQLTWTFLERFMISTSMWKRRAHSAIRHPVGSLLEIFGAWRSQSLVVGHGLPLISPSGTTESMSSLWKSSIQSPQGVVSSATQFSTYRDAARGQCGTPIWKQTSHWFLSQESLFSASLSKRSRLLLHGRVLWPSCEGQIDVLGVVLWQFSFERYPWSSRSSSCSI